MENRQVLKVDGMTCNGCERRVARALRGTTGVTDASADHSAGTVTLAVDSDFLGPASVSQVIENLGYELVGE